MQAPKYPYDRARSYVTSYFNSTSSLTGKAHQAWDIVPAYKRMDGLPADVYPVFSGRATKISDTDPLYGKGIQVKTEIWPHLAAYLKNHGISGRYLTVLYWHLLDVTDEDGYVDQNTPVGITGNTGAVFSGGIPVPDPEKGVPPYKGLHLHLQIRVDLVPVDPEIIFNYRPKNMSQIRIAKSKKSDQVYACKPYTTMEHLLADAEIEGFEIPEQIPDSDSL